jgi:MFS transporter, DHA2 family, multidrug resistance protein
MISQTTNPSDAAPTLTIHPYLGVAGVRACRELLALQVRQQAFTLAISDSFLLIAVCCVVCLVIVAFMSTVPTQYRQIIASSSEAK